MKTLSEVADSHFGYLVAELITTTAMPSKQMLIRFQVLLSSLVTVNNNILFTLNRHSLIKMSLLTHSKS